MNVFIHADGFAVGYLTGYPDPELAWFIERWGNGETWRITAQGSNGTYDVGLRVFHQTVRHEYAASAAREKQ